MRNQMSLQNDGNIYIKERFVEITSVNDPPPSFLPAYRIQCHSCMSAYLEDQFMYISHLYRRPLAFSEKCDHGNFDERYLRTKNCTDPCITLRINDKVGGRKRHGYIRGCLSDIIHYNHTAILASSKLSTKILSSSARSKSISTWTSNFFCTLVRLRDLFLTSNRYNFDSFDHIELCTCVQSLCNNAKRVLTSPIIYLFVLAVITIFWRF